MLNVIYVFAFVDSNGDKVIIFTESDFVIFEEQNINKVFIVKNPPNSAKAFTMTPECNLTVHLRELKNLPCDPRPLETWHELLSWVNKIPNASGSHQNLNESTQKENSSAKEGSSKEQFETFEPRSDRSISISHPTYSHITESLLNETNASDSNEMEMPVEARSNESSTVSHPTFSKITESLLNEAHESEIRPIESLPEIKCNEPYDFEQHNLNDVTSSSASTKNSAQNEKVDEVLDSSISISHSDPDESLTTSNSKSYFKEFVTDDDLLSVDSSDISILNSDSDSDISGSYIKINDSPLPNTKQNTNCKPFEWNIEPSHASELEPSQLVNNEPPVRLNTAETIRNLNDDIGEVNHEIVNIHKEAVLNLATPIDVNEDTADVETSNRKNDVEKGLN